MKTDVIVNQLWDNQLSREGTKLLYSNSKEHETLMLLLNHKSSKQITIPILSSSFIDVPESTSPPTALRILIPPSATSPSDFHTQPIYLDP
jgi:hypothetical protein